MEAILYTISVDGGVGSSRDPRRRLHNIFVPRQPRSRQLAATSSRSTLAPPRRGGGGRNKKGRIADLGGGWLGQPRRRLGRQHVGLSMGVPDCPESPGAR